MDTRTTRKTAILIDGGYYRVRARALWGDKNTADRATELFNYCTKHIQEPQEPRDLYRIFYYDCPPLGKKLHHPLTQEVVDCSLSQGYQWAEKFYKALATKRKFALRMGELAENQAYFAMKKDIIADLVSMKKTIKDVTEKDFYIEVKQKGVDMKIGLDVASLAYGRYVDQIILIAGDSDFIPVVKMARRNGIDFLLDPMGQFPKPNLLEHVDGIESYIK